MRVAGADPRRVRLSLSQSRMSRPAAGSHRSRYGGASACAFTLRCAPVNTRSRGNAGSCASLLALSETGARLKIEDRRELRVGPCSTRRTPVVMWGCLTLRLRHDTSAYCATFGLALSVGRHKPPEIQQHLGASPKGQLACQHEFRDLAVASGFARLQAAPLFPRRWMPSSCVTFSG